MATQTDTLTGNSSAELALPDGLTRSVIDLVADVDFGALPEKIQRRARHSLIDTLGVIALGSKAEPIQALRRVVLDPVADGGATVLGPGYVRANPAVAAMVNALAGHIRDFDDAGAGGHVSAGIVPAVLALAETTGASGADVLAAMVTGYETAYRITGLLTQQSYYLGFHSSGTAGTFGAAAAAARMLGLDREQWAMAFGIAGSLASGLLANFGSMTKPLHTANASRAGVVAARLAAEGFTSSPEILEHHTGFARTHTPSPNAEFALQPLGEPWALERMVYKFNAACSGTHAGADGMRRLVAEHGFGVDDVEHATVRVPRIQTEVANIPWPVNVEQAKFSVRWVAAAGLLGIDTGARFPETDEEIVEPRVTQALGLIEVLALPGVDHGGAAEVEVQLKSGEVLKTYSDALIPNDDIDAEEAAVTEKFRTTAASLWAPAAVENALVRLGAFEKEPSVSDFLADLTRSGL